MNGSMEEAEPITKERIKTVVRSLAPKYGVRRVYLFGSFARNEQTDNSDIDLRVDKGSAKGMQLAFLLTDLEDALNKKIDLVPTGALNDKFLSAISNDEEVIYES